MEYKCYYKSKIGTIILSSKGEKLTRVDFSTSRFKDNIKVSKEQLNNNLEIFNITINWLDKYFNKERPNPKEIPIELKGTEFCQKVWKILRKISYGETITYGEIARIIESEDKRKMSAQAVGYAVGHNPISIIVPCHRVIGANGNLTGYGGGIDKKIELLKLENVNIEKFHMPKNSQNEY